MTKYNGCARRRAAGSFVLNFVDCRFRASASGGLSLVRPAAAEANNNAVDRQLCSAAPPLSLIIFMSATDKQLISGASSRPSPPPRPTKIQTAAYMYSVHLIGNVHLYYSKLKRYNKRLYSAEVVV